MVRFGRHNSICNFGHCELAPGSREKVKILPVKAGVPFGRIGIVLTQIAAIRY